MKNGQISERERETDRQTCVTCNQLSATTTAQAEIACKSLNMQQIGEYKKKQ